MKTRILLTSLFILITCQASAYIPKLSTVLSKITANTGGDKAFIIKRTVTLKDQNVSANETWYIGHADLMKVEVGGKNSDGSDFSYEILYKNGKRHTASTDGTVQAFPLSAEFFEPLLHFRSSKALNSKLIAYQVLPTSSNADTYMSFDRFKGGVVYVLGATEAKNTQSPPRLWVEQDSFLIRKLRLGSQVEVEFENSKVLEENKDRPEAPKVRQPETQTVYWKDSTVVIQNTSTQIVPQSKVESHLKINKGNQARLPESINLKEFYSRFR